jgi:uncharacterized protein YoxC
MSEKKIDEKLAELCASIKEFSSLTDRTKAIETLAQKMAGVGKEHLSEAERRMKALCDELRNTLNSATAAPEMLAAASRKLNGKTEECVGEIDAKLADMEGRVSTCVLKLGQAVRAIDKGTAAAVQAIESKISEIESATPIDGFAEFRENVETRLSELEKNNNALGEKLSAVDGALKEIKEMVAKIPTKRGLFG